MERNNQEQKLSFAVAAGILILCISILLAGVVILKLDPHIPIFFIIGIVLYIGKWLGYSWDQLIGSMLKMIGDNISVVFLIMIVGVLVASFMTCGTVPYIIYYGLKLMSPRWFLLCAMVLCFLMAILTGSSFTTVGTLGVAFLGVGISMGIPVGIVAGAIISGALCGDKHSPLGTATNLAATVSHVSVYEVERASRFTSLPTMFFSGILFTLLGFHYQGAAADTAQISQILTGLEKSYHLTPLLLIPVIVLLIMIFLKIPSVTALITASMVGTICALLLQGISLKDCFQYMETGYVSDTGIELVDSLLSRGGLVNMGSTILLIIMGLALAGLLVRLSVIATITEVISTYLKSPFTILSGTFLFAFAFMCFSGDCHMSIVLTESCMEEHFRSHGIDLSILARCINDGSTAMSAMIPWSSVALYFAGTLGVKVTDFLPYLYLGYGTVLITLLLAITGIGVKKASDPVA